MPFLPFAPLPDPAAERDRDARPERETLLLAAADVALMIDGDTIEVHGQRIRLHGIDAPESRQLCRRDGTPWQCGKDAMNAPTAALISLCLR